MSTSTILFRYHRPILLWLGGIMVVTELIGVSIVVSATAPRFSFWLAFVALVAKYWLLVVGVMLVTTHLRQLVTNGLTRHEFLAVVGVFGPLLAVGSALVVTFGYGLESLLLGLAGERGPGYPVASASELAGVLGRALPVQFGYLLSGALIAAAFYRFRMRVGLLAMVPGALPIAVADGLLGVNESGGASFRPPYFPALLLSLVVIGAAAFAFHRLIRDVAIKRTAG